MKIVTKNDLEDYLSIDDLDKKKSCLFPVYKQPEQNIKNIFLSCLIAVKPLRERLFYRCTKAINNQTAQLDSYNEIDLDGDDRPDALLVLYTGKRSPVISWIGFIETKLGSELKEDQLQRYIDKAKEFDNVSLISISNDIVSSPENTPFKLKGRKLPQYIHFSWVYIKTECLKILDEYNKNSKSDNETFDVEQMFILQEFLRYMDRDEVKVTNHVMKNWKDNLTELNSNGKSSKELINSISESWMIEENDLCYNIYKESKINVFLKNEKKDKDEIISNISDGLKNCKTLYTTFVTEDKSDINLSVNLEIKSICLSCDISFNKEKTIYMNVKNILDKFSDAGDEHNLNLVIDYGRGKFASKTLKELLEEKNDRFKKDYEFIDKSKSIQDVKKIKIELNYEFERKSDFYSANKFDDKLETLVVTYFNQVVSTL